MKYFSWSDCWSWLARDRSISWTSSTMTRLVLRSVISWHAWWVSVVSVARAAYGAPRKYSSSAGRALGCWPVGMVMYTTGTVPVIWGFRVR